MSKLSQAALHTKNTLFANEIFSNQDKIFSFNHFNLDVGLVVKSISMLSNHQLCNIFEINVGSTLMSLHCRV